MLSLRTALEKWPHPDHIPIFIKHLNTVMAIGIRLIKHF